MNETGEKAAESEPFGWGIIGSGEIAQRFASDLALVPNAVIAANHSRTLAKAENFAQTYGSRRVYAELDSFMADSAIDAVYIATPNSLHLAQALKAVRSGKAILAESPLAPSHTEASVIQREAARVNVYAMEALWTLFLPAVIAAKTRVDAGEIGTIRKITAELAHKREYDPKSRYFSRSLSGGASLDLGLCCVALAMHFLGQPQKVSGVWHAAPNGVDMSSDITLHYDGAEALLSCGFDRDGANHFIIEGSKGALRLNGPFPNASKLTSYHGFAQRPPFGPVPGAAGVLGAILDRLPVPGRRIEDYPFEGSGLQFGAMAVMETIKAGKKSSPVIPLANSINALRAISMVLSQHATPRVIKL